MPVTAEHQEYKQLGQLIPLNTLKQDALNSLLMKIDTEQLGKGATLFNEGDIDHVNVYVLEGVVGLFENGREVDRLESGSATSRFPVAHQIPRKFSAKTLTKSNVVKIDSRLLSEALAQNEEDAYVEENGADEVDEDADWMTQLLQSNVMQHIPPANLQGVMMRMQEREVHAGDVLITEGEEGDYYYLLHRGRASVEIRDPETGENNEVAVLSAGASFGEDALLTNNPRSSTVKMITDGIILRLSKEDFTQLIKHPLSDAVSYAQAEEIINDGGVWLDVRDAQSYDEEHLPGAINMPHATIRFQLESLDTDRQYVVYSHSGNGGLASAYLLLDKGLNARSLEGGFDGYKKLQSGESAEATSALDHEESTSSSVSAATTAVADSELLDKIARLEEQLQEKDTALEQANAKIQELDAKPAEPIVDTEELNKLINSNKKLEREIIGLTEKLESQEDLYDQLKEKFDGLNGENKKHLKVRDREIAELKEKLTVLQLERDQAESDYEELLASNNAGGSDNANLQHTNNEVEQLEALNASIAEERDTCKFELEENRNVLSLANQEISELQLEIADLKGRLADLD